MSTREERLKKIEASHRNRKDSPWAHDAHIAFLLEEVERLKTWDDRRIRDMDTLGDRIRELEAKLEKARAVIEALRPMQNHEGLVIIAAWEEDNG